MRIPAIVTDLLTGLSLALFECIITGYEAEAVTLKVEF